MSEPQIVYFFGLNMLILISIVQRVSAFDSELVDTNFVCFKVTINALPLDRNLWHRDGFACGHVAIAWASRYRVGRECVSTDVDDARVVRD